MTSEKNEFAKALMDRALLKNFSLLRKMERIGGVKFQPRDKKKVKRLEAVLRTHFPNFATREVSYRNMAKWIYHEFEFKYIEAWNLDDELKKLEDLERALLVLEDFNLHWKIFDVFAWDIIDRLNDEGDEALADLFPYIIFELHDLLAPSIRAAKSAVKKKHLHRGKTNWKAVLLIDTCRNLWVICGLQEAPISLKPNMPFGRFVKDVFDVINPKGTPRSAMNAWRTARETNPILKGESTLLLAGLFGT